MKQEFPSELMQERAVDMYLAGEWQQAPEWSEVRHPYTGETFDRVPVASPRQIEQALSAAVQGAAAMRSLTMYDRAELLNAAAALMQARVPDLARLISLESGKPLVEATAEANRGPQLIRLSATEAAAMRGETLPLDAAPGNADKLGFTIRQPCGVVVAISPFNFPLLLLLHKVAPALAAGNAVISKPAEQTPLTALEITRIFLDAGFPENALQCVTGPGETVGASLCRDSRVRKISFTGSTGVGRKITEVAGIKKLSLELGANAPLIVLADGDLVAAATAAAKSGYSNAGQVCISVQRILVVKSRYADYIDELTARVQDIDVGDPFADGTTMGSLISEAAATRVRGVIERAVAEGASLVTGGERQGAILSPAVVTDVAPTMDLFQSELFGPAVAVTSVDGVDEAIALANATSYGLAAGIFTSSTFSAMQFARRVDAGSIQINSAPLWRADLMPYGGLKDSGIGKEGPRYAIEEMTEQKTVVFHGV